MWVVGGWWWIVGKVDDSVQHADAQRVAGYMSILSTGRPRKNSGVATVKKIKKTKNMKRLKMTQRQTVPKRSPIERKAVSRKRKKNRNNTESGTEKGQMSQIALLLSKS